MTLLKRFDELRDLVRRQGSHHFTVMVIPHTEKKIVSFQISNWIILYLVLMIGLAGGAIYLYQTRTARLSQDLAAVVADDRAYRDIHSRYAEIIHQNRQNFSQYRDELRKAFSVLGRRDAPEGQGTFFERTVDRIFSRTPGRRRGLPSDLAELTTLEEDINHSIAELDELEALFATRREVMEHIPSRWPLMGHTGYKTSAFGERFSPFEGKHTFHTGVDLAAMPRTPILAAANGTVVLAGINGGYGLSVIIAHRYGYSTLYGHCARLLVTAGTQVKRGQPVALLGNTGRATGYHVHFEVRVAGEPVDPWPYLTTDL